MFFFCAGDADNIVTKIKKKLIVFSKYVFFRDFQYFGKCFLLCDGYFLLLFIFIFWYILYPIFELISIWQTKILLLNNVEAKIDFQMSKFDFYYVQIQSQEAWNQFPAPKMDYQGPEFDSQRIKIEFKRLKIDSQRPKTDFLSQKTWFPETQNRLPKAESQLLRAQIHTRSPKLSGRGPSFLQMPKSDSQSPKIHSQRANNGSS